MVSFQVGYVRKTMRPILVLDRSGNISGAGGTFIYLIDEYREINCNMKFEDYPMDDHVCHFRIFSAMYYLNKLVSVFLIF